MNEIFFFMYVKWVSFFGGLFDNVNYVVLVIDFIEDWVMMVVQLCVWYFGEDVDLIF